jgi:hypothetical protein
LGDLYCRVFERPCTIDNLIALEALAIEQEGAGRAGKITYLGKILIQCTLPHRDPGQQIYRRSNGFYQLTVLAPPGIGVPWGRYPRLLLPWLTTEALKTKDRIIPLGRSLSDFMHEIGVKPSGGPRGPITGFRDQVERLFASTIMSHYKSDNEFRTLKVDIAREAHLWWHPGAPGQVALWGSYVHLTEEFYDSVTRHPVPLDTRVLRVLRSSLAMDLYAWATFRVSYLEKATLIPWEFLAAQFGGTYTDVKHFRTEAVKQLRRVIRLYPALRCEPRSKGLVLYPSPPHVKRLS